jgi:hypothetical protein
MESIQLENNASTMDVIGGYIQGLDLPASCSRSSLWNLVSIIHHRDMSQQFESDNKVKSQHLREREKVK